MDFRPFLTFPHPLQGTCENPTANRKRCVDVGCDGVHAGGVNIWVRGGLILFSSANFADYMGYAQRDFVSGKASGPVAT